MQRRPQKGALLRLLLAAAALTAALRPAAAVQDMRGAPHAGPPAAPNVTVALVHTATELRAALARGAAHIEIRRHIDLLRDAGTAARGSFTVGCRTRSIRVRSHAALCPASCA